GIEIAIQQCDDILGRSVLGQGREPAYVREQHGYFLSAADACRIQGLAARQTGHDPGIQESAEYPQIALALRTFAQIGTQRAASIEQPECEQGGIWPP